MNYFFLSKLRVEIHDISVEGLSFSVYFKELYMFFSLVMREDRSKCVQNFRRELLYAGVLELDCNPNFDAVLWTYAIA